MTIQTILESITSVNLEEVKKGLRILQSSIDSNQEQFFNAIKNNNLDDIKKAVQWGLTWDAKFWSKFSPKTNMAKCNKETVDYLFSMVALNNIKEDNVSIYAVKETLPAQVLWEKALLSLIGDTIRSYNFNPELFLWCYENNKVEMLNKNIPDLFKKFCEYPDISLPEYEPIHNFFKSELKEEYVPLAFKYIKNKSNFNFCMNDSDKEKISKLIEESSTDSNKIMTLAISQLNVEKIYLLLEQGFVMPNNKEGYSNVFGKRNNDIEKCKEILNLMNSVTVGNHVILKSALHNNCSEYMPIIIEKYFTEKCFNDIDVVLKGREQNKAYQDCLLEKEKYALYFNLQESLPTNVKARLKMKV